MSLKFEDVLDAYFTSIALRVKFHEFIFMQDTFARELKTSFGLTVFSMYDLVVRLPMCL